MKLQKLLTIITLPSNKLHLYYIFPSFTQRQNLNMVNATYHYIVL
nr:MAG TPA: hypothetical protein [Caudoviricetes sp.]